MSNLLHTLQHSLGLDQYGRGTMYRNHFVTGEGSTDWVSCNAAVEQGLMIRRESALAGGDSVFIVTDAGKAFVRTQSPAPPKLTRGQRRYAAWLAAEWFPESFAIWLKSPYSREVA